MCAENTVSIHSTKLCIITGMLDMGFDINILPLIRKHILLQTYLQIYDSSNYKH